MANQIEPLRGAEFDTGIYPIPVAVLDDVYILNPERITRSEHRACVVRLVDIFKNDGYVPRSGGQNLPHSFASPFRHKLFEDFDFPLYHTVHANGGQRFGQAAR